MIKFDGTVIDPTARIAETAIIGNRFRPLQDGRELRSEAWTVIGPGVWIGQYTIIGRGAWIGSHSQLEEFVEIQPGSEIGARVVVTSRSRIGIGVLVGNDSVIRGHVGDYSQVGDGCRIAGDLIHRQLDPSIPWDDPAVEEPAPVVRDGAFIGWRALIVGGINIGEGAYICAGSLITKDVPPGYIAYGRNQLGPPDSWPGALGKSSFFYSAGQPRQTRRVDVSPPRYLPDAASARFRGFPASSSVTEGPSGSRRPAGSSPR
jgi:acetyltransferase-like isoleucine patch superfamily enzyme